VAILQKHYELDGFSHIQHFANNYGVVYKDLGESKVKGTSMYYASIICFWEEENRDDSNLRNQYKKWTVCGNHPPTFNGIELINLNGHMYTHKELRDVYDAVGYLPKHEHSHNLDDLKETKRFVRELNDKLAR
jgi:hypothetical protein